MKTLVYTNQFKRDYKKRQREKGLDALLDFVFKNLSEEKSPLPVKFRDHSLKGNYSGCREYHLKPDLLLIYISTFSEIRFIRLGNHSELFN
ncbi:MAG: type II toxin-antitoxin system YafQ family toxin [Verrucomicrobia bacterium]|nr:type II toxin-antitoxin system YafQ family toxin [Verrucomicrobiota bacterium]